MSNLSDSPEALVCEPGSVAGPELSAYPGRRSVLGAGLTISRALPHARLRMVGPWCFLDHIGPVTFSAEDMIDVAPHPHIGLQTATWMIDGELLHKDSLGYEQLIRPGQLNLMTAGRGISHSEESPDGRSADVHGVQFWIALPAHKKDIAPDFEHFPRLPVRQYEKSFVTLFVGDMDGMQSPARCHSPLIGAELVSPQADSLTLPLEPGFEHALMLTSGRCKVENRELEPGHLYYLGGQREQLKLETSDDCRLMLIGGEPFNHPVLLWWNFVGHSDEDIRQARQDWLDTDRFGNVNAYRKGTRLEAPALDPATRLR